MKNETKDLIVSDMRSHACYFANIESFDQCGDYIPNISYRVYSTLDNLKSNMLSLSHDMKNSIDRKVSPRPPAPSPAQAHR